MATEDNKNVIRRFNEGVNEYFRTGNIDPLLETVQPGAAVDVPGMPPTFEGLEQVMPAFRTAFPDLHLTVGELIANDDKVAYRVTWTGTHTGEFMGIPATNKRVTVSETHISQIANGKIARHAGDWDQMGMMQQLGVIPSMG